MPSALTAQFDLPKGWVRLPPPDAKAKGMLRRDPFESLARQMVSSGSVLPGLAEAAVKYMRFLATTQPPPLALATHILAPGAETYTFANYMVLSASPPVPGSTGFGAEEELAELAAKRGTDRESEHLVTPAVLDWGRGVRSTWTLPPPRPDAGTRQFVGYWVIPDGIDTMIVVVGDVTPPSEVDVTSLVADIDALALSTRISQG